MGFDNFYVIEFNDKTGVDLKFYGRTPYWHVYLETLHEIIFSNYND